MALYTVCVCFSHDCNILILSFCFSNGSSYVIILAMNLTTMISAMPAALENMDILAVRRPDVLDVSTGRMLGLMR